MLSCWLTILPTKFPKIVQAIQLDLLSKTLKQKIYIYIAWKWVDNFILEKKLSFKLPVKKKFHPIFASKKTCVYFLYLWQAVMQETKQTTLDLYFTAMIISAVRIIVGATYQTGIMHKVSAHAHLHWCMTVM